ncbi:MAG: short-chain fatty acid transporter [Desulfatitalea sp.]|nr:TIGR00366 family protein [Desulfatitalea sp.]NNJ99253.1 short-chain fatty acid transporter [Desulfatitalea sp.]
MIRFLGELTAEKFRKWLPDSFSFALILTFIAMVFALTITNTEPIALLENWYKGFWMFLKFSMQMALIVVLGYAVGNAPAFSRIFDWLGSKVNNPTSVYLIIVFIGGCLSWIFWGFAVSVAVMGMELARRVKGTDYRFVGACAYISLVLSGYGLSVTAPLLMNTPGNQYMEQGLIDRLVPPSETIFSTFNLTILAVTIIIVFMMIMLLKPKQADPKWDAADRIEKGELVVEKQIEDQDKKKFYTPAESVDRSIVLTLLICICGIIYIFYHFGTKGLSGLNLDSLNFTFFMVGMALWGRPSLFAKAVLSGVRGVASIIIQFPFYAGIMGIFMFSGLSKVIAAWLISISSPTTFPWFVFLSSSIVNIFVPSNGGEWLVIGGPLIQASKEFGYPMGKLIMAFTYGDLCTNLIQPFWTLIYLPVLGRLLDLRARDIMGYTAVLCIVHFITVSILVMIL